jgi:hypothetical protein
MEWTNMMDVLSGYNHNTTLTVYWPNGIIIDGFVDTISETCTCELEEDDPNYQEYYMCVMKITDIVELPNNVEFNEKEGDLIEISVLNEPLRIETKEEGVVWKK